MTARTRPGGRGADDLASRGRTVAAAIAAVGALWGWLMAVPMEHSFRAGAEGDLPYAPDSWAPAYAWIYDQVGEPLGLSEYYFWGKFAFLLYVAGLLAVRALPRGRCRRSRAGRRMFVIAFAVGLVGDLLGYWSGTGEEMTSLTEIGFIVLEVPAMLLMVVALGVSGSGLRHDRVVPSWAGWAMVAGAVLTPPFSFFAINYVPHGVLVPVLATLAVALTAARR